jgi:hypothetical protein
MLEMEHLTNERYVLDENMLLVYWHLTISFDEVGMIDVVI